MVLEVDTYWATAGGADAPALLRRLGDRVRAIHVKDGGLATDGSGQVPAGQGRVPVTEILAAAPHALRVIEFDRYDGDIFAGLAASLAFLRRGEQRTGRRGERGTGPRRRHRRGHHQRDVPARTSPAFPDLRRPHGRRPRHRPGRRAGGPARRAPPRARRRELLADPEVELVVNLTIPAAHVDVGLAALEAGKHVWAEKPLALDRPSARKLLDRARELDLRVASAPDTVLGAGLQTARRAIDAGRIGEPRTALALFQSPGPESWHPGAGVPVPGRAAARCWTWARTT